MNTQFPQINAPRSNFWIDNHIARHGNIMQYPRLSNNIEQVFDVAVLGGGWFGLNTALKLHEQGKSVVVLEADKVPTSSVAAWSTGKISSQHQIKLSKLLDKHGESTTKLYSQSNQEAIADIENIIQRYNIQCDYAKAAHIVFATSDEDLHLLKDEEKAAQKVGYPAIMSASPLMHDLPPSVELKGTLRVDNQGHMNIVSYLSAVAEILFRAGVPIYEYSRVQDVSFTSPHEVTVENGSRIVAKEVVVATHMPILNRTGHFARNEPSRSYCIAFTLQNNQDMIKETYITASKTPTVSLRPADNGRVLVASGFGHPAGEYPEDKPWGYDPLEQWVRQRFQVRDVISRWSAMDYYSSDELPFMGLAMHGIKTLYTATGFAKWGFTQGIIAAQIVTDIIMGIGNRYEKVYDARRWDLLHSAMNDLEIQAHVAKHFVKDRLKYSTIDIEDLVTGQGGIFEDRKSGDVMAMYRDEKGVVHKFSPSCPHLGCYVQWNCADKIFECPCHGSNFSCCGDVLHGPSTKSLSKLPQI